MNLFGLDIGSQSIKLVQLGPNRGGKYDLLALGMIPAGAKSISSEAETDLDGLAGSVKKLWTDCKVTTKNVSVALPQDKVYTSVVTMPKLSEDELTSALKWEAEQYIPYSIDEATLAHEILSQTTQDGKEVMKVLLVAAQARLVEKYLKVTQKAGLTLVSVETEMLALGRSLVPDPANEALVVDFGSSATDFGIIKNGHVVLNRSIPTGGLALTRAVSYDLNLEENQAEAYKKAYGLDKTKLEGKVANALNSVVEVVIREIEKTLEFYTGDKDAGVIKQIILSGGSALLPQISNKITEKLSAEVSIGNPFQVVTQDNPNLKNVPQEAYPYYAVAFGLAMKEVD